MTARQSAATDRGLRLIARGVPLRTAAARVGVAASTLVRARKRANLEPLPKGRPSRSPQPPHDRPDCELAHREPGKKARGEQQ